MNIKNLLNIHIPKDKKLFVVGDIHEHHEQFDKALNYFSSRQDLIFVSIGDILNYGFGNSEYIINKIKSLVETNKGFIIKGNHEINIIRQYRQQNINAPDYLYWIATQPLALSFIFNNGTRATIVHGGILPTHTFDTLLTNIEVAFCRLLDENNKIIRKKTKIVDNKKISMYVKDNGTLWHDKYDGRFGYVISGHNSQKDGVPKFYNYSCNIDTACYSTGILTAIIFGEKGREGIKSFVGKAKMSGEDNG